jgi:L-fuconolactonase
MGGLTADDGAWIVDAHCHLWDIDHQVAAWPDAPPPLRRSFAPGDLVAALDRRVAAVVLVEAGGSPAELALLHQNAAATQVVGASIAYADPLDPALAGALDALQEHPACRGVRLRFEGLPPEALLDRRVAASVREIAARGLVAEFLVTTAQLPALRTVAAAVPGLRGIVDHLAKPTLGDPSDRAAWRDGTRALARDTLLAMKLSVSPRAAEIGAFIEDDAAWSADRLRPYVEHLLETFGPARLAWGSDWPIGTAGRPHGSAIERMTAALGSLPGPAQQQVFAGTAAALYGLGGIPIR